MAEKEQSTSPIESEGVREYKIAILASIVEKNPSILYFENQRVRDEAILYNQERKSVITSLREAELEEVFTLLGKEGRGNGFNPCNPSAKWGNLDDEVLTKARGDAIKDMLEPFLWDKGVMIEFIKRWPGLVEFLNDDLINDIDIIKVAIKGEPELFTYERFDNSIRSNIDVIELALEGDSLMLEFVPEEVKDKNRGFVFGAIKRNGEALQFVSGWDIPKEILLEGLKNIKNRTYNPILDIDTKWFSDIDIGLALLELDASNYRYLDTSNYLDVGDERRAILTTLRGGYDCIDDLPEGLFYKDKEIALEVIRLNGALLCELPDEFRNDRQFLLDGIEKNPELLGSMLSDHRDKFSKDLDFLTDAYLKNSECINYFPTDIRREIVEKIQEFEESKQ